MREGKCKQSEITIQALFSTVDGHVGRANG